VERKVIGCFEKIEVDPGAAIEVIEAIGIVPNETDLNEIGQTGIIEQIMMTEAIEVIEVIESYSRNGTNGSIDRIGPRKWIVLIVRRGWSAPIARSDRIAPGGDGIDAIARGLTARGSSEIA